MQAPSTRTRRRSRSRWRSMTDGGRRAPRARTAGRGRQGRGHAGGSGCPGAARGGGAEERAGREAEATAEGGDEPVPARGPAVELASDARIQATGKRKTSIARVILRAGNGSFEINKRSLEEYFPRHQHQTAVRQPLLTSGYEGKVDVRVRVHGGGISGQAGAVRHGIARALTEIDGDLRGELKRRGLLTRDARAKERRKAGLKKARKRPQFSKR